MYSLFRFYEFNGFTFIFTLASSLLVPINTGYILWRMPIIGDRIRKKTTDKNLSFGNDGGFAIMIGFVLCFIGFIVLRSKISSELAKNGKEVIATYQYTTTKTTNRTLPKSVYRFVVDGEVYKADFGSKEKSAEKVIYYLPDNPHVNSGDY